MIYLHLSISRKFLLIGLILVISHPTISFTHEVPHYHSSDIVIGNPREPSPYIPGGPYSLIGDTMDPQFEGKHLVSCYPPKNVPVYFYDKIYPELSVDHFFDLVGKSTSFDVIYFIEKGGVQYIYGTETTSRGFSNGKPVYVLSKDWKCSVYNSLFDENYSVN